MRLWAENKFLVTRRDGTVPDWPWFVLGARDPAAPAALRAYAAAAEALGMDLAYAADLRDLAAAFEGYRALHGTSDPDAAPHRQDDPAVAARIASRR